MGEELEASQTCDYYTCIGADLQPHDDNCRMTPALAVCGANAVCQWNSGKGTYTCAPGFEEQQEELEASQTCSDFTCIGADLLPHDDNCRNYQAIRDLCGANAVCEYNSGRGTYTCAPAFEEQQEELEASQTCDYYTCIGADLQPHDDNCRNYQAIRDL